MKLRNVWFALAAVWATLVVVAPILDGDFEFPAVMSLLSLILAKIESRGEDE